jgi:toxin ParE1/3/4
MARIIFKQAAIDDLNNIWNYTRKGWSENQADKYYNLLKTKCLHLVKNPEIGKRYSEIEKDLLGFKAGKHIIFYKVLISFDIEIIRILHERMDVSQRMS